MATLRSSLSEDPLGLPYMYLLSTLDSLFVVCTFLYHSVWPPFDVYSTSVPALFVTILCTDDGSCITIETSISHIWTSEANMWSRDLQPGRIKPFKTVQELINNFGYQCFIGTNFLEPSAAHTVIPIHLYFMSASYSVCDL